MFQVWQRMTKILGTNIETKSVLVREFSSFKEAENFAFQLWAYDKWIVGPRGERYFAVEYPDPEDNDYILLRWERE